MAVEHYSYDGGSMQTLLMRDAFFVGIIDVDVMADHKIINKFPDREIAIKVIEGMISVKTHDDKQPQVIYGPHVKDGDIFIIPKGEEVIFSAIVQSAILGKIV